MAFALLMLLPLESAGQWSVDHGETVRNAFGPSKNQGAPMCRGACGMDCGSSCEQDVEFQCAGALIRVQTYSCGTHQDYTPERDGCRLSGKSMDEVFSGITITTGDGQVLGAEEPKEFFPEPGVPTEVALSGVSGHLFVPIFELKDASPPGTSVEHVLRCSQQAKPVIETRFRLHFGGS